MTSPRMQLGLAAEGAVCEYLRNIGYSILDRNWRRPWGELDIVAIRGEIIHFVEVKSSSHQISGFEPILRANDSKMHKVKRTAQTWLLGHRYSPETEWQIDIASVIMSTPAAPPDIEYFEHAYH